ncbi:MAG TPA: L-erythro-3,5-diaminohexanoate dehydrogenase [Ktedonobacteraceae bacterium]|jgi:L-erythro-3,5-diaminohexanoate dehydrogenase
MMERIFPDDRYSPLGYHRVMEPAGLLPQAAWRLDNTPVASPTETLVDVHCLHIDSASFAQIAMTCDDNKSQMRSHIQEIVRQRGKMHNPVTGSGGVLLGTIRHLDEKAGLTHGIHVGDAIVSLTSLSWLPLYIERIHEIYLAQAKVEIEGKAIFFQCNPMTRLPDDLPPEMALAALDVAGAPARAFHLARPGQQVTVLGAGGTAGLLTICALRQRFGTEGKIIAVEQNAKALQDLVTLDLADVLVCADATKPREVVRQVREACHPHSYEADLTINVVNVPHTEPASILLTRPEGHILFFSMATSFTAAALGAEGLARRVEMSIGNGYMPDHGVDALQLLRTYPGLFSLFKQRFCSLASE